MLAMIGRTTLFCAALLAVLPAGAAESAKSLIATRTESAPRIDGRLDDPAWASAVAVEDLYQNSPRYGEAPTEVTVVRILYDDDYLYIAAELRDREPAKIKATQLIQGRPIGSDDRFFVAIDSFNSKRNDYLFEVNANGVRSEALRENNTRFLADWVAIWDAASEVTDQGWTTEIAIPFKSISFDSGTDTWGLNFGRWIIRKQEFNVWSSNAQRLWWAAESGQMTGIQGIRQGIGLDIVPSVTLVQQRNLLLDMSKTTGEPSLDAFYKFTPSLSGVLTINTDFSSAEVDDLQVALDQFSLFFPEKRDFFLQDAGIFEFGNLSTNGRPFFSRRIGLSASGRPIDLIAGVKLTGRAGRYNVGVLGVRQEADRDISARDLFVGRLSANVMSESSVGVIMTSGNPTSEDSNTLLGADFQYRNSNGPLNLTVQGQAWIQQTESPDREGDNQAFGASFELPNDRLNVRLEAMEIQENFNPALGFVNRVGIRQYQSLLRYRTRPKSERVSQIDNEVASALVTDIDGALLSRLIRFRPIYLSNFLGDSAYLELRDSREMVTTPFRLFGRLIIPVGDYEFSRYRAQLSTGQQRPVSVVLSWEDGGYFGGDRLEKVVDLQWRQSEHFSMAIGLTENIVELPSGNFTSQLGRFRTDVAFNSSWSWSNLVQYDNVARFLGINSRLRYTPVAGREFLLVLNYHWLEVDDANRFVSASSDVTAKALYTFRF